MAGGISRQNREGVADDHVKFQVGGVTLPLRKSADEPAADVVWSDWTHMGTFDADGKFTVGVGAIDSLPAVPGVYEIQVRRGEHKIVVYAGRAVNCGTGYQGVKRRNYEHVKAPGKMPATILTSLGGQPSDNVQVHFRWAIPTAVTTAEKQKVALVAEACLLATFDYPLNVDDNNAARADVIVSTLYPTI
jgi:hypothetical protein